MVGERYHGGNLRRFRRSINGQYYFLTAVTYQRQQFFLSADRARIVIDAICWLTDNDRFVLEAAVVMPDHFHLVGRLSKFPLADLMHTLKGYSGNKIAQTGVNAPIWQAGYHDSVLKSDEDLNQRVRYVLQNPVRAGLVARTDEYPHIIYPSWWASEDEI